jgi:hypothetical protein
LALVCPDCAARSLTITSSLELPPDSRSDEITLQVVRCTRCRFSAIAVYEESRRGGFDSESVDHRGFRVSADDVQAIEKTISACPRPRDPRCKCAAHRALGGRDAGGRWNGLAHVRWEDWFPIGF